MFLTGRAIPTGVQQRAAQPFAPYLRIVGRKSAALKRVLQSPLVAASMRRTSAMVDPVVARSDRMIGPQLRPAKADCIAKIEALHATRANARSVPLLSPRDPCIGRADRASLKGGAIEMSQVAQALSNRLNRVVRDQTELAGMFEIELTWTSGPVSQTPLGASQLSCLDPKGLSISKALQEQLGLRLEPTTGPVDVLVIDSAGQLPKGHNRHVLETGVPGGPSGNG